MAPTTLSSQNGSGDGKLVNQLFRMVAVMVNWSIKDDIPDELWMYFDRHDFDCGLEAVRLKPPAVFRVTLHGSESNFVNFWGIYRALTVGILHDVIFGTAVIFFSLLIGIFSATLPFVLCFFLDMKQDKLDDAEHKIDLLPSSNHDASISNVRCY